MPVPEVNSGVRLTTPRLILRPWRREDFEPWHAMLADPDVAQFLTWTGRPFGRSESWRALAIMIGHWELLGFGLFAVESREGGECIGRCGIWRPEGWPGVELGYALCKSHWGRGFALEAAGAAAAWFFERYPDEPCLISLIHADNVRSQNVAMRLGAVPDRAILHAGRPHTIWRLDGGALKSADQIQFSALRTGA